MVALGLNRFKGWRDAGRGENKLGFTFEPVCYTELKMGSALNFVWWNGVSI